MKKAFLILFLSTTLIAGYISVGGGGGGGSSTWGSITGTLSSQTDLQSALNAKQNSLSFGSLTSATTGVAVTGGTNAVIGSGTSLSIQTASGSQPGLLSAADWTTFNGKQSALTLGNLSTSTTGVSISGGTGAVVGSGATVNVQTASGSQSGLLSSADWTTFNGKQVAGNYITALTGEVTASGPGSVSATIANSAVTNAKLANMADVTIKGNNSGGSAAPSDLSATTVTSMLNNFVGDSGSGGTKGLVPAPASGDAAANKFLKANGSWTAITAGDFSGPGSSTDNAVVRFDGTGGKTGQNSLLIVNDNGDSSITLAGGTTSALTLSNGTAAAPILTLKDNTTTKLEMADGGNITQTSAGTVTASNASYTLNNSVTGQTAALTADGAGNWGFQSNVTGLNNNSNAGNGGVLGFVRVGIRNVGVSGIADGGNTSGRNIGVYGYSTENNSPSTNLGGYFEVSTSVSGGTFALPTGMKAALAANNLNTTSDIFQAYDGSTLAFNIADGGAVTSTITAGNNPLMTLNSGTSTGYTLDVQNRSASRFRIEPYGTARFNVTNSGATSGADAAAISLTGTKVTSAGQFTRALVADNTIAVDGAFDPAGTGVAAYGAHILARGSTTTTNAGNLGVYVYAANANKLYGYISNIDGAGGTTPKIVGNLNAINYTNGDKVVGYWANFGTTSNAALFAPAPTVSAVFLGNNGASGFDLLNLQSNGTSKVTIADSGTTTYADSANLAFGTSTGTKIGTATSQKIGFWNATPIVQPTTAITAATFAANTSGIIDDSATFDGYTIGQIVKALRNAGLLQ